MKELMRFDTDKYHQAIQQHTLERHIKKLDEMGFEYLGGYLSNKTPMQIRCKVCGTERTVTGDFIGRKDKVGRWNTVRCKHCLEKESRERRAEKEKQEEERKARRLLIATLRRDIKALAKRREKASAFFFATCEECGEEFITDKKKKYCSQRCVNRRNNRVLWQNREKRIRDALVDKDLWRRCTRKTKASVIFAERCATGTITLCKAIHLSQAIGIQALNTSSHYPKVENTVGRM